MPRPAKPLPGAVKQKKTKRSKPSVAANTLPRLDREWALSAVGVDNLRALRMPKPLPLRRLMIVVGRNGIGKSTFARLFPLLRQSSGARTREPLLWWERDQVDFGSFADAIRHNEKEMTFTFEFTRASGSWTVASTLCASQEGSRVSKVHYKEGTIGLHNLTLTFGEDLRLKALEGSLGRQAFSARQDRTVDRLVSTVHAEPWCLFGIGGIPGEPRALLRMLKDAFHGNMSLENRCRIIGDLSWRNPETLKSELTGQQLGQKYQQKISELVADAKQFNWLRQALFCWHVLGRLRFAETLLERLALRTSYLGPFRAVPERTYRHQSIAVEQLDARGANLAMFIAALGAAERRSLNAFLQQSLGFEVNVLRTRGQYELRIGLGGRQFNLLDVGFGYSQILPVVVQLWAASQSLSTNRTGESVAVFVVEQPELHLHPHHQVLVARAMAMSAMSEDGPMQVVETHSDHLVSEIGMLIAKGQLQADRVGVVCVEPKSSGDGASVRIATFDEDGVLQNWPAGFLSP